jgi:cytochrome d ubiquinol oxidase subunit II
MMGSIAPVWDGNETWLIIVGTVLFGAFPVVYAIFLSAFYLPVALLLVALILRGVAFEFRYKTQRGRWLWDSRLRRRLGASRASSRAPPSVPWCRASPSTGGRFAGGPFDWVAPFPILCGVGLVLGYMLLGAGWLVLKTEGALRDWAYAGCRG